MPADRPDRSTVGDPLDDQLAAALVSKRSASQGFAVAPSIVTPTARTIADQQASEARPDCCQPLSGMTATVSAAIDCMEEDGR